MKQPSHRQTMREAKKKKEQRQKTQLYAGIGIAIIAVAAVIFFISRSTTSAGPPLGDVVPIASSSHVPADTVPGPYASNPPAGGTHFDESYPAKFFEESDLAGLGAHPEGHLVHSLEHGYVIFWYNCQAAGVDCAAMKQMIQKVMNDTGGTKLIAFPWTDMDVPLAMTSWGRILKFPTLDAALMKQFVQRNRYKAPEPNAS